MGYWTSLNLNIIILMVSPYQNSKLKIQMLAGNSLNVCPDSDSQKKLPLVHNKNWLELEIDLFYRSVLTLPFPKRCAIHVYRLVQSLYWKKYTFASINGSAKDNNTYFYVAILTHSSYISSAYFGVAFANFSMLK